MKLLLTVAFSLIYTLFNSQHIYSKAYGNQKNPAVIFIHGGPSGNATLFEGTTAQRLADRGFYVIVYDRRGEGRSKDSTAMMTFNESFNDLNQIYQTYHLKKASILAHSFGGIIGTLFTRQYPEKVSALVLAGALFTQQETYDHILKQGKETFKDNPSQLKKIAEIESLSKNSADYRKRCYGLASEMHFFTMPSPTAESRNLRKTYEDSEFYAANFRNPESPKKFYKNEPLNNLDNTSALHAIKKGGIPIYAVYGKNDGIFSEKQLNDIKNIAGRNHFNLITNCSHYLFADQQNEFLKLMSQYLK